MSYPTSLDSFTTKVDASDYPQASHINVLQTAVEALEAKVGITNSAVATSIDYIIKNNIWPVGSVFTAVVATDPATLLGFGTWSQIAEGKVLVGQNTSDSDFNVAEETGGDKTANLAHTHTGASHTHTGPSHTHTFSGTTAASSGTDSVTDDGTDQRNVQQAAHTHTYSGTTVAGGTGNTGADGTGATSSALSATQSIMNPYFVVYFWKRTA